MELANALGLVCKAGNGNLWARLRVGPANAQVKTQVLGNMASTNYSQWVIACWCGAVWCYAACAP